MSRESDKRRAQQRDAVKVTAVTTDDAGRATVHVEGDGVWHEIPGASQEYGSLAEINEPTAKLWGLWLQTGQGWVWCEVELPRSVVERYLKSVSVPDRLPFTLAHLEEAIQAHAGRGVAG